MQNHARTGTMENDRILPKVDAILENSATGCKVKIISLVLFGSKALGDKNSLNDYEFMLLLHDDTALERYICFNNTLRLELLKANLSNVKIMVYTPLTFENTLYQEKVIGTYLYIICRDHVILIDEGNTFASILTRLGQDTFKPEEKFLEQCVEFAKDLGSEKWIRKWEKTLLQHRYSKKRKNSRV